MTENEAIEKLQEKYMDSEYYFAENDEYEKDFDEDLHQAYEIAICALKEIKQYWALGTAEELREAMEKQRAKKPACKPMPYSEEVGLNDEWLCPACGAYVGHFSEGMSEPEQMEYCNECGQHIARDWSEEE